MIKVKAAAVACLGLGLAACGDDGQTTDSVNSGSDNNGGTGGTPTNPSVYGRVQFSVSSLDVSEGAGAATISITRTEGSDGAISVLVTSRNGSATADDFTPVNTTVTFAAGDSAPKTVTLNLTNDTLTEPDETLYLDLTSPTGGAGLGSANEISITILDDDTPPAAPRAALSSSNHQLHMQWTAVPGATSYRLLKDPTGSAGFTQIGNDLPATARTVDFDVSATHLEDWLNARYAIAACKDAVCTPSTPVSANAFSSAVIDYLKASNARTNDLFGSAVAVSSDGNTLVVGAPHESSAANGIDGNPTADCDNPAPANCSLRSGAVYVYTRTGATWSSPTYLKPTGNSALNTELRFGRTLALSNDGNTLMVGAPGESSSNPDVNAVRNSDCTISGPVSPNCAPNSGAVFIYTRSGGAWSAPTFIKAPRNFQYTYFSDELALSGDGNTAVVGLDTESSAASGINGNFTYDCGVIPAVNCSGNSGAAFVYSRNGATWQRTAYVKAPTPAAYTYFGSSVALSDDGNTLAIGATAESVAVTDSGGVYVYNRSAGVWGNNPNHLSAAVQDTEFGGAVALSGDGNTLAVGAERDYGGATGINGSPNDCSTACLFNSGAAYVFSRSGAAWSTPTYFKSSAPDEGDNFGTSLALSKDGKTLVVLAAREDGAVAGVHSWMDTASKDNGAPDAGAAYVFVLQPAGWSTRSYVKASNPKPTALFGTSVALNADGSLLVVGAIGDSSAATGLNGNQVDDCSSASAVNCQTASGAAYIY